MQASVSMQWNGQAHALCTPCSIQRTRTTRGYDRWRKWKRKQKGRTTMWREEEGSTRVLPKAFMLFFLHHNQCTSWMVVTHTESRGSPVRSCSVRFHRCPAMAFNLPARGVHAQLASPAKPPLPTDDVSSASIKMGEIRLHARHAIIGKIDLGEVILAKHK